jgi:hypothetical protein
VLWLVAVLSLVAPFIMGGCSEPDPEPFDGALIEPVSELVPAEHPRDFPESLRWLTEEEKAKLVETALSTPMAQEWLQKESQCTTKISWIALNPDPEGDGYSGYRKFEYEIVEIGIPRGELDMSPEGSSVKIISKGVPEDAEIYPDVTIWFGEPAEWIVSIAIDSETWEVVYQEGYYNLSHPDRFKGAMGGE